MVRRLEYLHEKKVVHRDIKSENLLMTKQGHVKLADFGVARVEAANPRDMTGSTGTLGYMAPEVERPPCPCITRPLSSLAVRPRR